MKKFYIILGVLVVMSLLFGCTSPVFALKKEKPRGRPTTTTTTSTTIASTTSTTSSTTTLPPSTTTTTPPDNTQPQGPVGPFRLVWGDEFDGSSLDLTKWRPNWFGSTDSSVTKPINTYEESCYDPANVTVANGLLNISAVKLAAPKTGCLLRSGASAAYSSGMIFSNYDYRFTYGYYEVRMNLPGANGSPENWPAFWSNGQTWPTDGEIDVMEVLGGEPRWHYHYQDSTGHRSVGSGYNLIDPKTGWHTFGALWEPNKITFYYDGKDVGSVTSGVVSTQHYFIINYGLSSTISGPIVTPSTVQVDWVRHWIK